MKKFLSVLLALIVLMVPLSEALESEAPQTFQEKLSAFFEQITRFFDDLKSGTLCFLK